MTTTPESPAEPSTGEPLHRRTVAAVLVAGVSTILLVGFLRLPREAAILPDIARQAMVLAIPRWGTLEPVSEIVYGTRGFDTFGETFLLLAAVVSVTTLTRSREQRTEYVGEAAAGRTEQRQDDPQPAESAAQGQVRTAETAQEHPVAPPVDPDRAALGTLAPERAEAMTVIVRVAARAAAMILMVTAVYLAAWGFSPGGGFPAGAALSGVAVLLFAGFGYRRVRAVIRPAVLEPLELAGAAAIIGVELVGLIAHGSFGANWLPLAPLGTIRSGGIMQAFSGAELVEVGTGLTIAMFSLLGMTHDWTRDEDEDAATQPSSGQQ